MTAMPVHEFRAGDGDGPFRGVPFRFIVAIGLSFTGPQHGRKRNPAEWVEAIAHLATGLGLFHQFRPNADAVFHVDDVAVLGEAVDQEIGRASCRERVWLVAVAWCVM